MIHTNLRNDAPPLCQKSSRHRVGEDRHDPFAEEPGVDELGDNDVHSAFGQVHARLQGPRRLVDHRYAVSDPVPAIS